MYCKYCGKEIADDSKFCQHCGGQIDTPTEEQFPSGKNVLRKYSFSDKEKLIFVGYGLWVVINLYWLLTGDKSDIANELFQPFAVLEEYYDSDYSYYDLSEFIVYCIGLPLLIVGVFLFIARYYKALKGESPDRYNAYKTYHKKTLMRICIWAAVCFVVSLLDFWEDKTFDGIDLIWWIIIGSIIICIISNWNELSYLVNRLRNSVS